MHEHLLIDWPRSLGLTTTPIETSAAVDRVVACLDACQEVGVSSIVDVGAEPFGPSPLFLLAVAARTAVHIVASTGCFTSEMLPPPGWAYPPATVDDIAARFIRAATAGQAGSGVKPGLIKVGTGDRTITEIEERIFRAAAVTQRRTGMAITTHTNLTHLAMEQVDLLEDSGADLDRVVIGHVGWGTGPGDFELHERLVKRGVTVGLDLVGSPARSDEQYARIALDLIHAGFSSRILFSHDGVGYSRGLAEVFGRDWLSGDFGIVHRRLLPLLREAGVEEKTIQEVLVENPRRILTIDPKRYPGAADTLLQSELLDPVAEFEYRKL
jgi:phosphotriesterase-related protein